MKTYARVLIYTGVLLTLIITYIFLYNTYIFFTKGIVVVVYSIMLLSFIIISIIKEVRGSTSQAEKELHFISQFQKIREKDMVTTPTMQRLFKEWYVKNHSN